MGIVLSVRINDIDIPVKEPAVSAKLGEIDMNGDGRLDSEDGLSQEEMAGRLVEAFIQTQGKNPLPGWKPLTAPFILEGTALIQDGRALNQLLQELVSGLKIGQSEIRYGFRELEAPNAQVYRKKLKLFEESKISERFKKYEADRNNAGMIVTYGYGSGYQSPGPFSSVAFIFEEWNKTHTNLLNTLQGDDTALFGIELECDAPFLMHLYEYLWEGRPFWNFSDWCPLGTYFDSGTTVWKRFNE